MKPIPVIALKPFTHEGRDVAVGEALEVSPIPFLALSYARKVRPVRAAEPAPRRRHYRRRDLTAEKP